MEKITSTFPPTENVGGGQVVEEDNLTKGSVPIEEPREAGAIEIKEKEKPDVKSEPTHDMERDQQPATT